MRKSKLEAAETRRKIVKTAAAEFCGRGIHATGLSELMGAAGLTHGGFYRHFESKDQLVTEACAAALQSFSKKLEKSAQEADTKHHLDAIVGDYLSPQHRDNLAGGCPLAGLGSELARAGDGTREAVSEGFLELAELIAKQYRGMKPAAAKARALVALATMVGALTMSRIVKDDQLSDAILSQAKRYLTGA